MLITSISYFVQVQWNVCHSLGYLFLNETLTLQDMSWSVSKLVFIFFFLLPVPSVELSVNLTDCYIESINFACLVGLRESVSLA